MSVAEDRPAVVAGLRLDHLVGRGGEGEVWAASDRGGRWRALKLVVPEALATPAEVERRAAWLTRIDHPALVRVHRSGLLEGGGLDGWGYVEMDLIDGDSLADAPADWGWLDRLGPLAEALDLLHAGVWSDGVPLVHRDVKPANILDDDGALVLVDHSTLRGVDSTTLTRVGTPVYAAPEILTGRFGPPVDVYALAVTAVALVSGARGAALARLIDDASDLDLPEGVRAGLAPDPVDRPVSCRALLDELEPVLVRDVPEADAWGETWVLTAPPAAPGRRPWGFLAALAAMVCVPLLGWSTGELAGAELAIVAGVAALGHLLAHLVARRSLLAAALVPPVAWALLLAARAAPLPDVLAASTRRMRRARARLGWTQATLTGALTVVTAGVAAALSAPGADLLVRAPGDTTTPALLGIAGVAAAAITVRAARGGRLARVVLTPLWLLGAVVLLVGCLVVLLPALLASRARAVLTLAGAVLAGGFDLFRR